MEFLSGIPLGVKDVTFILVCFTLVALLITAILKNAGENMGPIILTVSVVVLVYLALNGYLTGIFNWITTF
jgi:uncharacterized membrane protein